MKKSILLVEDHPIVATATQLLIESTLVEIAQVIVAESGQAALDAIRTKEFHLILLDIGLPDFSGFEVIERMHKLSDCCNIKTPLFILTAHDQAAYRARAECLGVTGYLVKPLTTATLTDCFKSSVI